MSELERIAYDNALRVLDKQEKFVEEMRARTSVMLAAASLAVSLLGGRAFDTHPHPVLLALTAASFVVSLGGCLVVLLARPLAFAVDGVEIHDQLYAFREDTAEVHRRLTRVLHRMRRANGRAIVTSRRALSVAAWSLVAELLLLMSAVVGGSV